MMETVGSIRKTDTAEVRISRSYWKGRPVVDLRIWFVPDGSADFVPSRKGLTIDVGKLPELVNLLSSVADESPQIAA